MIFHNKILLVLIGCMITNSCFAVCECHSCEDISDCSCPECIGFVGVCPDGTSGCTYTTETVQRDICNKLSYVSECDGTDYSFENVLATWTNQQYRFKPKCWAVDGSLTTAQHYQNMRALFAFEKNLEARIAQMDTASENDSDGCMPDGNPDPALETWLNMLSTSCLNNIGGIAGLSYVCLKCPDNGNTGMPTRVKYNSTVITKDGEVKQGPTIVQGTLKWLKFNTIANCYIKSGEDERGEFELDDSDAKCYYSKE